MAVVSSYSGLGEVAFKELLGSKGSRRGRALENMSAERTRANAIDPFVHQLQL